MTAKIEVDRDAFLHALNSARRVKDDWARVVFGDGALTVTCDNHVTRVEATVPATGEGTFEGQVGAKMVADLVKSVPSGAVTITDADDGSLLFTADDTNFRVRHADTGFFPQVDSGDLADVGVVPARYLIEAFARVEDAAAKEDSGKARALEAICMDPVKGHLRVVATDSYRIHVTMSEIPDSTLGDTALLPAASAAIAAAVFDPDADVQVAVGAQAVEFSTKTVSVRTRLIDGNYIEWQNLVKDPSAAETRAQVDTRVFRDAAARAVVAAGDDRGVTITFTPDTNRVTIDASDNHRGSAYQTSFPAVSITGGEMTLKLNAQHLIDALDANPEPETDIALHGPLIPAEFRSPGDGGKSYTALVATLRI